MSWLQQDPPQTINSSTLMTNTSGQNVLVTNVPSSTISSAVHSSSERQQPMQPMHKQHLLGQFNNNPNQSIRQNWQQQNPSMMDITSSGNQNWSQQNVVPSPNTYQYAITPNNWQEAELRQQNQLSQQAQPPSQFGNKQQDQEVVSNSISNYVGHSYRTARNEAPVANSSTQPQQQQQQQVPYHNVQNFFDNGTGKSDGWDDWDWNDTNQSNNNNNEQTIQSESQRQQEQHHQNQQHQQEIQLEQEPQQKTQKFEYNSNIIENSFNNVVNDNWQWNNDFDDNKNQLNKTDINQIQNQISIVTSNAANLPTKSQGSKLSDQVSGQKQFSDFDIPTARTISQFPLKAAATVATTSAPELNQSEAAISSIASPLSHSKVLNENFNDIVATTECSSSLPSSSTTASNISNSVYFSQAKPVLKPSRQFAGPACISPSGEVPAESTNPQSQTEPYQYDGTESQTIPTTLTIPLQQPPPPISVAAPPTFLPPVGPIGVPSTNPFKRVGAPQHNRSIILSPGTQPQLELPPPPADFANPTYSEISTGMGVVPDNSEILHENQEVLGNASTTLNPPAVMSPVIAISTNSSAGTNVQSTATYAAPPPPPNDERNQYLQTSHLSENPDEELNAEGGDHLPPPGLSRLVLGEPELEASQRMVTGIEEMVPNISLSNMNLNERHADGEDTSGAQPPVVPASISNVVPINIDITADRNLYTVPGESNINAQRVVTGVERHLEPATGSEIINEQREIELDGENLEDQQLEQLQQLQQQPPNLAVNRNEPPVEGAASTSAVTSTTTTANVVTKPLQMAHGCLPNAARYIKRYSGSSDEEANKYAMYMSLKHEIRKMQKHKKQAIEKQLEKQNQEKQRSVERYNSEDSDDDDEYPIERDHDRSSRHSYREGPSTRNGQEKDRDLRDKKNRRDNRQGGGGDFDSEHERGKHHHHHPQYAYTNERRSQRSYRTFDADSKYETEESVRPHDEVINRKDRRIIRERGGERDRGRDRFDERTSARSDRSERDYEDYRRHHHHHDVLNTSKRSTKRNDVERRGERHDADEFPDNDDRRRRAGGNSKRAVERDYRDDFNTTERRQKRLDKSRNGGGNVMDYEEYRKRSSRNTRGSDLDKEQRRNAHQAATMYTGYPPSAFGYDPYSYYYEQMARTNPQAYAEWYKKYYGHAADLLQTQDNLTTTMLGSVPAPPTDGRESVHSGRSSTNYDKDRFTKAYITQANEYHRHFMQQQQQQQRKQQHHHTLESNLSHSIDSIVFERNDKTVKALDSQNNIHYNYNGIGGCHSSSSLPQTQHAIANTSTAAVTASFAATACGVDYYPTASSANLENIYYNRSNYAESRSDNLSRRDIAESTTATDPQRLTPCKFVNDHCVVSFSAGILITVKPKYSPNGASNIVKLLRLGVNDATRQLFQSFPGPLVRGLTHKKTIIEFCEEQIRLGPSNTTIYAKQILPINVNKYKASYTLIWNLLILLLRQNGMVVGTDIAELLLRNQEKFPYKIQRDGQSNSTASNSVINSKSENISNEEEEDKNVKDSDNDNDNEERAKKSPSVGSAEASGSIEGSTQNGEDSVDLTSKVNSFPTFNTEEQITAKFRNYLLYGNVNEALDWATDNNLWGHALFLASKVDRRLHANVMMKFANKLSLNDPLQTLYQLMSGRTPSSVTCIQDEKWGDWRPHLSMILSNTSQKPELDRKAITTLGDSLFHQGDLYAAHFCYLMAQVGFGRYQESAIQETTLQQNLPKLVLLGSSHYKSFKNFATNESIIMTEIYEYACSLNDEKFSLIEFQPYKYLLATRLLDYGYHLKSLMYMEQIASHIEQNPDKFELAFINKVFMLADRLKFYDPSLEKTLGDSAKAEGHFNNASQDFEEQKWLQTLRDLMARNEANLGNSLYRPLQPLNTGADSISGQRNFNEEFTEINRQFNELNMQYNNISSGATADTNIYNPDNLPQSQQMHVLPDNAGVSYSEQQQQHQQHSTNVTNPLEDYNISQQQTQVIPTQQMFSPEAQMQSQEMDTSQQGYQTQYGITQSPNYYDPSAQQQNMTVGYNASEIAPSSNNSYDHYWERQQNEELQGFGEMNTEKISENTPAVSSSDDPLDNGQILNTSISKESSQSLASNVGNTNSSNNNDNNSFSSTTTEKHDINALNYGNLNKNYKVPNNHNQCHELHAAAEMAAAAATVAGTINVTTPQMIDDTMQRPSISMPNSKKIYDSDAGAEQQNANQMKQQQQQISNNSRKQKSDDKENTKSSQSSTQNSGWFGGIWNKLSLKPKNQMILPDDKNPTIVWDPEKKRWVNTEGADDAAEDSIKPPPKMSELPTQQHQQLHAQALPSAYNQQQHLTPTSVPSPQYAQNQAVNHGQNSRQQMPQQQQPLSNIPYNTANVSSLVQSYSAIGANVEMAHSITTTAPESGTKAITPSLQSNMFKKQRNRTLKNSYVDVFNPSGAPMSKVSESVLAPALPPAAVPPGSFFIPGAPATEPMSAAPVNSSDGGGYQQDPSSQDPAPQFYNPNQFGGSSY